MSWLISYKSIIPLLVFSLLTIGTFTENSYFSSKVIAAEAVMVTDSVGVILSVKGKVVIISKDGEERKGAARSKLFVGDRIETGKRALVQLNFRDGSTTRLAGNSDYTVADYVYDEETGEAVFVAKMDKGAIKFLAGKISKMAPQNYKIVTATATIGIRGSAGEGVVTPESSSWVNTAGHVIEVTTSIGELIVMENPNPSKFLMVTSSGETSWLPMTMFLFEEAMEEQEEDSADDSEAPSDDDPDDGDGDEEATETETVIESPDSLAEEITEANQNITQEAAPKYTGRIAGFNLANIDPDNLLGEQSQSRVQSGIIEGRTGAAGFEVRLRGASPFSVGAIELPDFEQINVAGDRTNIDADRFLVFRYEHDAKGEFIIANNIGATQYNVMYIAATDTSITIPNSGVRFYGTDNDQAEDLTVTSFADFEKIPVASSMLIDDRGLIDLGFASEAMVDFGRKKVFGMTQNVIRHQNLLTSNTYYYATLDANSNQISDMSVYGNLNYFGTTPFNVSRQVLSDYSGGGAIYGSRGQGLGVYADSADASGHFVSAGFQKERTSIQSVSGLYTGLAQGIKMESSDPRNYSLASLTDLALSPDFSRNQLSGAFFLGGQSIAVGGSAANVAYDRGLIFGALHSSSLVIDEGASFITSWDQPSFLTSVGELATPDNTMWGGWNIVSEGNNSSPDLYPGINNYWVAARGENPGELEGAKYYQIASANTYIYNDDGIKGNSDTGFENMVIEGNKVRALTYVGGSHVIPVLGTYNAEDGSFSADSWSTVSLLGTNSDLFDRPLSDVGAYSGRLAGNSAIVSYQRDVNNDLMYGVGVGTQVASEEGRNVLDLRGFSVGMSASDGLLFGGKDLVLNFKSDVLSSDLKWEDSDGVNRSNLLALNPSIANAEEGEGELLSRAFVQENPADNFELNNYSVRGDLGLVKDFESLNYSYKVEAAEKFTAVEGEFDASGNQIFASEIDLEAPQLAPRVTFLLDLDPENGGIIDSQAEFVSGPNLNDSFNVGGLGDYLDAEITQTDGNVWLITGTDGLSPQVTITLGDEGEATAPIISFSSEDGQALFQKLIQFEDFADAKITGLEISLNVFGEADQYVSSIDEENDYYYRYSAYIQNIDFEGGGESIHENWDITKALDEESVYISKDYFYIPEAEKTLKLDDLTVDASSPYVVSLPGLEDYSYLSWGLWRATVSGGSEVAEEVYGYFAVGDQAHASNLGQLDAYRADLLANGGTGLITYTGGAIGSIMGGGYTGEIIQGTSSLSVDFTTGKTLGEVTLGADRIDLLQGTIDALRSRSKDSLIFTGGTSLNGAADLGSYTGQFYGGSAVSQFAQEAAGTFNASDGAGVQAIGAFGVKQD